MNNDPYLTVTNSPPEGGSFLPFRDGSRIGKVVELSAIGAFVDFDEYDAATRKILRKREFHKFVAG